MTNEGGESKKKDTNANKAAGATQKKKEAANISSANEATTNAAVKVFTITHRLPDFLHEFNSITHVGQNQKNMVSVTGKVQSIRRAGRQKKSQILFYDIHGDGAKLQLMASAKDYAAGAKGFSKTTAMIKVGDTIGAHGYAGRTKGDTVSVFVVELVVLDSVCPGNMLPDGANGGNQDGNVDNNNIIQRGQKIQIGCEGGKRKKQRKKRNVSIDNESKQTDAASTGQSIPSDSVAQSLPVNEVVVQDDDTSVGRVEAVPIHYSAQPPLSKNAPEEKMKANAVITAAQKKAKNAERDAMNDSIQAYISHSLPDFISKYKPITKPGTRLIQNMVSVAGCVQSIRWRGEHTMFYGIYADGAQLQLMTSVKDYAAGAKGFHISTTMIKIGDTIGARGYAEKTNGKKLSVFAVELVIFHGSSCPDMLPSANGGDEGSKADNSMQREQESQIECESVEKSEQRKNGNVCTEDESKQIDASSNESSAEVAVTSNNFDNQSLPAQDVQVDELDLSPIPKMKSLNADEVVLPKHKEAKKEATKADVEGFISRRLPDFISKYNPITQPGTRLKQNIVAVSGRVQSICRGRGKQTVFYDIHGGGAKLQLVVSVKDFVTGAKGFRKTTAMINIGDAIGAHGYAGKSKGGTLSVFVTELADMLPDANAGGQRVNTNNFQRDQKAQIDCESGKVAKQQEVRDAITEEKSKQKDASSTIGSSTEVTATSNSLEDHSLSVNEAFQIDVPLATVEKVLSEETGQLPSSTDTVSKLEGNDAMQKEKKTEFDAAKAVVETTVLVQQQSQQQLEEEFNQKDVSSTGSPAEVMAISNRCGDQDDDIGNTTDDSNGYSSGRGGPLETSKSAWAAARAQREQSGRENCSIIDNVASREGEEDDILASLRAARASSDSINRVAVNNTANSVLSKIRIGDEWEKYDNGYTKTKLEEDMEILLQSINDTEVGLLSSTLATLSIELPDGEGGSIVTAQDQNLSEAAAKIMNSWRDKKKWTKKEARIAGQILLRMEKEEVLGEGAAVEKQHYLAVINAYAKVTAEDETASIRAENLLDHMERRASERIDLAPDRLLINTAMGAHAKHALSGNLSMNSILAAERMLATLEREYAQGDNTMQPTARTYSKFIDLYAKNGLSDKAVTALDRMECQYRRGNKAALPKTIHYTSVIDSLAKSASSSSAAARTAEKILRSMLDLYDKGERHLAPDTIVFSATIDAYAKSWRPDAPERSLAILDLMDEYSIYPDIITYNTLLNTLSKSPNYQYFSTSKDILHYIEKSSDLRADQFTYNAIIKGAQPEEAEKLIQHWEMEYKSGRTDERPNAYTYCSLIKSWTITNTIGYEEKCLEILNWMDDNHVIGMNRIVYNETMKACSRSNREDAGDLAFGVFNKLLARYKRTNDRQFRPDAYSYMILLTAHTRSCESHESAMKSQYVLFDMMDSNVPTDTKLCNSVIASWARSGSDEAILRAEEVCSRMEALSIKVDAICFNSLINVYAKSNHPEKSYKSLQVLERMKERRVTPNSVTYTMLFEACKDDDGFLMKVFESCIERGLLDERLQNSFRDYGPACLKERLNGTIPYVWSENANRGPAGPSRNQIRTGMKRGSVGGDVSKFGWAR